MFDKSVTGKVRVRWHIFVEMSITLDEVATQAGSVGWDVDTVLLVDCCSVVQ